jgi:leader peptidase (prepilin peptidase) / N-methyltransferase
VLSWLLLGGKCRHCKTVISPRYAAVELLTGALFALAYYLASEQSPINPWFLAAKYCVFSFLLVGLIFTDAETKLLPDLLTKPGIAVGLLFSLFVAVEGPTWLLLHGRFPHWANWRMVSLINSLAGAAAGAAFILGIALLYQALRGVEGMGMGDVKLMALIGTFLGVKLTLVVLMVGSLIGSVFGVFLILAVWRKRMARRRKKVPTESVAAARKRSWHSAMLIYRNFQIPFGVFLGIAALLAGFWGDSAIHWYWGMLW